MPADMQAEFYLLGAGASRNARGDGKRRRHIHRRPFTTVTATANSGYTFATWTEMALWSAHPQTTRSRSPSPAIPALRQLTTGHSLARAPAGRSRFILS